MSQIQTLLDKEAELSNRRYYILQQIKSLRGDEPPHCWGMDDCSTLTLSQCPWRIDCSSYQAEIWQQRNPAF